MGLVSPSGTILPENIYSLISIKSDPRGTLSGQEKRDQEKNGVQKTEETGIEQN
jgi:hypothetical protein